MYHISGNILYYAIAMDMVPCSLNSPLVYNADLLREANGSSGLHLKYAVASFWLCRWTWLPSAGEDRPSEPAPNIIHYIISLTENLLYSFADTTQQARDNVG